MSPHAIPDFAIVGVARAGTTSLASWLNQHPEIHVSPIKETNFFSRPDLGTAGPGGALLKVRPVMFDDGTIEPNHVALIDCWESYRLCLTPKKPGVKVRGEASVSYAFYPEAAARLQAANPACKIVFSLRHPVMRAISNYALFHKLGFERLTLAEAVHAESERLARGYQFGWSYTGLSEYQASIGRFLQHFPLDQVHIAQFESLVEAGSSEAWQALLGFLGIEPGFFPKRHHLNESKDEQTALNLDRPTLDELTALLRPEIEFYERLFAGTEPQPMVLRSLQANAEDRHLQRV